MKQLKRKRAASLATTDVASSASNSAAARVAATSHVQAQANATTHANAQANAQAAKRTADARRFSMPASCTVRDSVVLHTALLEMCTTQQPVVLDMTAIERIDTAAMQLLCAFVRDRRVAGATVEFAGSPEPFCEAVRLLGLQQLLGLTQGPYVGNHADSVQVAHAEGV